MVTPYYDSGGITIWHGDCREILPGVSADLLLTDPPYGINVANEMAAKSGQKYGTAAAAKSRYEKSDWDLNAPSREVLDLAISRAPKAIVWGGNYMGLPASRGWLVWDKENDGRAFADCELAWTNLDIPVRIRRHMWNGMLRLGREERNGHPTQKPLGLMAWCIGLAGDAQTILDPFMGSGTTLRAAKDLGRRAIGIEIEERYCEIAANRMRQGVLFGQEGGP